MLTRKTLEPMWKTRELQEFLKRLHCFEASDLVEFFKKFSPDGWDEDDRRGDYIHEKSLKFIENPVLWFLSLDVERAEKFYAFIMYEWQGDWSENYRNKEEELRNAKGMTKEFLETLGIPGEAKTFMEELKGL